MQGAVQFVNKELPGVTNASSYFWDPDYEPLEQLRNDFFVITIDLAEGLGQDYTTYVFNKLDTSGEDIKLKCIGYYSNNYSNID